MKKENKLMEMILTEAMNISNQLNHGYIGSEHILYAISKVNGGARKFFLKYNITDEDISEEIEENIGSGSLENLSHINLELTHIAKSIIDEAYEIQNNYENHKTLDTIHLLASVVLKHDDTIAYYIVEDLMEEAGVNDFKLEKEILKELRDSVFEVGEGEEFLEKLEMCEKLEDGILEMTDGKMKELSVPTLEKYGVNMNKKAMESKYDPLIGREKELQRIIEIIGRRTKNNPILAGVGGCGKSALIEGLAQKIVNKEVPMNLLNKQIYAIEISSMVAGSKYRGDFEEKIKKVIKEASENPEVILFIDEIHTLVGSGASDGSSLDGANILKPALSRGEVQCIGATTMDEYRKTIEKDSALNRRFQLVKIDEPTKEQTLEILKGLRPRYEKYHGVTIPDEILNDAIDLSVRYITDRYLPDKAIDLIDEASSKVKTKLLEKPLFIKEYNDKLVANNFKKEKALANQQYKEAEILQNIENELSKELNTVYREWKKDRNSVSASVNRNILAEVISTATGIPVDKIGESENQRLVNLDKTLKEKIKGQDEAIEKITKAVKRNRVGLGDPNKPIASFLLAGPTGCGKTYLAKQLAKNLFGSEDDMIRIDMSEFMDKHNVSRLVGSTPGFVGYEEGGQLTEAVRRKPYSVVLFDEIEKAHPEVFNIFLQILEDGRLTDGQGNVINFKNTIILMTSNVGSSNINMNNRSIGFGQNSVKKQQEKINETVENAIKEKFRPEFINRIDDVIKFNKLTDDNLRSIIKLLLKEVSDRIKNVNINIDFDDEVVNYILNKDTNREYGARPFKRLITKEVEDVISEEVLLGNIKPNTKVQTSVKDEKLVFSNKEENKNR